jgi:uncharacterized membrane protein
MFNLLIILHVVAAMIWLGGMFFSWFALRPAISNQLQPPQRLPLWAETLTHFFRWVWLAIVTLWFTGLLMIALQSSVLPLYIHMMATLAFLMTVIFILVFFVPFRLLKKRCLEQVWSEAGKALNQIRMAVATNLFLGSLIILVACGKWPV